MAGDDAGRAQRDPARVAFRRDQKVTTTSALQIAGSAARQTRER